MDKQLFFDAMRQLAAGVTIVASDGQAGKAGITATSVTSVTAEPPTMLVCINIDHELATKVQENGLFSIQVLGHDQESVSNIFAGAAGLSGADRFAQGDWGKGAEGQPVLAGAIAHFVCRVTSAEKQSSHLVVFGEVIAAGSAMGEPLLYFDRGYRALSPKSI